MKFIVLHKFFELYCSTLHFSISEGRVNFIGMLGSMYDTELQGKAI